MQRQLCTIKISRLFFLRTSKDFLSEVDFLEEVDLLVKIANVAFYPLYMLCGICYSWKE